VSSRPRLRGRLVEGLRARGGIALAALLAVAAGLAIRYGLSGAPAKYGGVALWSCMAYAGVLLVRPTLSVARAAIVTLIISWGVELAQLTPLPAALASKHLVLRLLLGTTFSLADLPAYAGGVALAAGAHALARRRPATLQPRRDQAP
jgi:hypothetical protein